MATEPTGGLLQDPNTWVAIGFVVFVAFAGKKLWTALGGILDTHAATVKRQIDEASALRKEAETLLVEAKAQADKAKADAAQLTADAHAAAERLKVELQAELEATLARRQKAALDKIAQAEASALADVKNETIRIAIQATGALLAANATGDAAARLVDQAIADLPNRLN
ncbi:MAG: F0F1 ATP synthase subunit B [Elstera sp.]|jgi:F-type H+-transporting ATPase subunit b|uniref:F0F1 ATP synthase subunit B family protein n=1 Tax=Elstera sp. TaxID=1916664 RepID=UPI0037BEA70F